MNGQSNVDMAGTSLKNSNGLTPLNKSSNTSTTNISNNNNESHNNGNGNNNNSSNYNNNNDNDNVNNNNNNNNSNNNTVESHNSTINILIKATTHYIQITIKLPIFRQILIL